jgi:hypothetical protein
LTFFAGSLVNCYFIDGSLWAAAEVAGLPAPVGAEAAAVPADHGLQLDDDRVQERRAQSIRPNKQQSHRRVTFSSESLVLDEIGFQFEDAPIKSDQINWRAHICGSDLLEFCRKLANLIIDYYG